MTGVQTCALPIFEEVARALTGWTVTRIPNGMIVPFPDYVTTPVTTSNHSWVTTELIAIGDDWQYFKGTEEPSPDGDGVATLGWAQPGFDDVSWLVGPSGFGYGANDAATVFDDMGQLPDDPATPDVDARQPGHVSVYVRKTPTVPHARPRRRPAGQGRTTVASGRRRHPSVPGL